MTQPAEKIAAAARILESSIEEEDHVMYACLMDETGKRVAEKEGAKTVEEARSIRSSLHGLAQGYPRGGLARAFIEDEMGTIALYCVAGDLYLAVAAEPGSPLGAVSMTAGRVAERIKSSLQTGLE